MSAFFCLAVLGGCTSLGGQGSDPARDTAAYLAPDLRLDLPDPASMGHNVEAVQMVTAHRDGRTIVFEAHLSITAERVLLVGVDATGQRLMTVTWRGSRINVETAPVLPKEVRPGAMLADIVTIYWPEQVVRQALRSSGADLSVTAEGRTVTLRGRPILRADYHGGSAHPWQAGLSYRNLAWGYDIDVVPLQVSE
ncbi:MAG TPA: DUF3261 domain-containing protein [Dongiaceae bacterium]|nr:DUF3261 domain-containing protein [Dongiaceae bacterium]